MANLYEVPAAKALLGAAFIQYLIYAVFYLIEGAKLQEFEQGRQIKTKKERPAVSNRNEQREEAKQEEHDNTEDNGRPADLKDIALEEHDGEPDQTRQGKDQEEQQHHEGRSKASVEQPEDEEEEEDIYNLDSANFIIRMSKSYQKSTVWFMLAIGFAAVRAANNMSIAVAYIHLFFRIIQLIGAVLSKRRLSQVAYIFATFMIIIMFFSVMVQGLDEDHFFE